MQNTETRSIDTILQKGVRVKLPAPFFLRPFKKEIGLVFRQPYLGTLLHISKCTLAANFDTDKLSNEGINEAHSLIAEHSRTLARIAAMLYLNGKWSIRLFSRLLSKWLLWKLSSRKLAEIAIMAVAFGGMEDFTTTIRLIGAMRMSISAPKNQSHNESGS